MTRRPLCEQRYTGSGDSQCCQGALYVATVLDAGGTPMGAAYSCRQHLAKAVDALGSESVFIVCLTIRDRA